MKLLSRITSASSSALALRAALLLLAPLGCSGPLESSAPCRKGACGPGKTCVEGVCAPQHTQDGNLVFPDSRVADSSASEVRTIVADMALHDSGVADMALHDSGAADSGGADSLPAKPDTGPFCGDKHCDSQESCISCPGDCGPCACKPGQVGQSDVGCAACQHKERSCKSGGVWGLWGACKSRCGAAYTCRADRCARDYSAYQGGAGPICGTVSTALGSVGSYCQPGDWCEDFGAKLCRKYQFPTIGTLYGAYRSAGGTECNYLLVSGTKEYYYCAPGDRCVSLLASDLKQQRRCAIVGAGCQAEYTPYASASGPWCGTLFPSKKGWTDLFCRPGDACQDSKHLRCLVRTTCPAGTQYHAYPQAGGAQCGYRIASGGKLYTYCKPLDLCVSAANRTCRK